MDNLRFDFSDLHKYGRAFYEFLALRKQVFVDELKWDVPHNDTVEMDQYDTPMAHYSIVMHEGRVIEEGSPAELLRQKGRYYSLWQKQTTEAKK